MPLVLLGIRVPDAHAEAIKAYAETLTRTMRVRVTPSAAGAAVVEAGLVALGLIEASERSPKARRTPKRPAPSAKKGAKRAVRKP